MPEQRNDMQLGQDGARVEVVALLRGPQPELRAARAERQLIRTIAEWPPGSGVDVSMQVSRASRVRVTMRPLGTPPITWHADVTQAMAGIAEMSRPRTGVTPIRAVTGLAELIRDPVRGPRAGEDDDRGRDGLPLGAPSVAWPLPTHDATADVLGALQSVRDGFIRILIGTPTPLERAMLHEEMIESWDRSAHPDLDAYLGSPILIRTFVGQRGAGIGFPSLRAHARGWATGLVLRDAGAAERARFDRLGHDAVAGHVRPEGWALGMLRLPASGQRPAVGIPSKPMPIEERPLDRVRIRIDRPIGLGTARSTTGARVRVTMDAQDLCRHVAIEGATGTGKTTFLAQLVAEISQRGYGCTLLEHHGTGVDQALRAIEPSAAAQATVIRHGDPSAPAVVNIFREADPQVREQLFTEFVELMQSIFDPHGEGIVGPRWRRWFTLLCDGVATFYGPDATLLHLLSVASDPDRVRRLAAAVAPLDGDLARRIDSEIGSLRGDEAANLPAWAISKFQPLVGQRAMREIVGRAEDSVDVTRAIDEGRTILVDLGGPTLGAPSARMLGAIWLLKHWVAMGRRADRSRPHFIVVDEAHLMTIGALPAMLAEARKFGVGLIIAGQSMDALAPALQTAIEANVASFASFRTGMNTAGRASLRLDGWPATELMRLPDLRAAARVIRSGSVSEPFLLTVERPSRPEPEADAQATAADERCAALWRGRATSAPVTDPEIDRRLADALALRERTMPSRPRVEADNAPDGSAGTPAFLDQWLADRAHGGAATTGAPILTNARAE